MKVRISLVIAILVTVGAVGGWLATGRDYYTKFQVVEQVRVVSDANDPLAQSGFYDDAAHTETKVRHEFHLGLLPTPSGLLDKHLLSVLSLVIPVWLGVAGLKLIGYLSGQCPCCDTQTSSSHTPHP